MRSKNAYKINNKTGVSRSIEKGNYSESSLSDTSDAYNYFGNRQEVNQIMDRHSDKRPTEYDIEGGKSYKKKPPPTVSNSPASSISDTPESYTNFSKLGGKNPNPKMPPPVSKHS